MNSTTGPVAPIDRLLADAYVTPVYDKNDTPTLAERASRAERAQLAYELDMTSALVLGDANSATLFSRLVDKPYAEPGGALVFGCLLHLTGHDDASRLWWQFAAGGGIHLAAYCLYLHHARNAESDHAHHWRRETDKLRNLRAVESAVSTAQARTHDPLLPEHVYLDIVAQCHRGRRPRLPRAIEKVVDELPVVRFDADFGDFLQPSAQLPSALAAQA